MEEWLSPKVIPDDGVEIEILFENGHVCRGWYSNGPPGREIEWGGWMLDGAPAWLQGKTELMASDVAGWRPHPMTRTEG